MGLIINNELNNYIEDIEPINDRITTNALSGTVPVTIICNYTPTAKATFEEKKTEHYKLI